ncbi:MAG: cyclic lactone autoinducer peptide [Clostridiales bacterium GWF2_38_85]|nr:MAG: cyclic lactone autoinducer peptide [Clostridiales bacterium GWF2_38_85]HBL85076.1 cyclic lactone autoinducer peptide [Clostridiales bacterium]
MKKTLFSALAVIATVVATLVASSACWWFIYQPEEPVSLQDK